MISHKDLIIATGGRVNGDLVEDFGVKLIAKTESCLSNELLGVFGLTTPELALESINSQITYLSEKNSLDHLDMIINGFGHNVSHGNQVSVLISGIKESTILELVSNKDLKCSRLTTSKTASADNPLYIVNEYNREFTQKFIELRKEFLDSLDIKTKGNEKVNEFSLETKALSIVIHSELLTIYKYCHKKLGNPYEYELQNVCKKILKEIEKEPLIMLLDMED